MKKSAKLASKGLNSDYLVIVAAHALHDMGGLTFMNLKGKPTDI